MARNKPHEARARNAADARGCEAKVEGGAARIAETGSEHGPREERRDEGGGGGVGNRVVISHLVLPPRSVDRSFFLVAAPVAPLPAGAYRVPGRQAIYLILSRVATDPTSREFADRAGILVAARDR